MNVVSLPSSPDSERSFFVVWKDGSSRRVKAGCYFLTSDGMYTFYRESTLIRVNDKGALRIQNQVVATIKPFELEGIYDSSVIELEDVVAETLKVSPPKAARSETVKKKQPKQAQK